jgi:type IV pilus assembly protein PilF
MSHLLRQVIIVLNLLPIFSLLCFILLQACQHSVSNIEKPAPLSLEKSHTAAAYNTQLGLAYLKQGDMPRAKRKLLTALNLNSKSPDAHAAMAYFLEKTGNLQEAKNYYQKALILSSHGGAQLNNYGTFLCRMGNYNEAEQYFLKAARDVRYIYSAAAYENAALCAEASLDYIKAENYFLIALKQDPKRKLALSEWVTLMLKKKHGSQALRYLQNYQELVENDTALLKLAIEAARQAGKKQLILVYQQKLIKLKKFQDYTGAKNEYNSSNG